MKNMPTSKNVLLNLYAKSPSKSVTMIIDEEIDTELEKLARILKQSKSCIIRDILRNVLITRNAKGIVHKEKGGADYPKK